MSTDTDLDHQTMREVDIVSDRRPAKRATLICLILLPLLLGVGGCISSSNPSPPSHTTVVVPQSQPAVCANGAPPPCP